MDRSLPPGAKLSEPVLCRQWRVSRTPIREALRRLESEGLIRSSRYRGFTVNTISMEDMEKIYAIMINLDSLAGRLATPFLSRDPKKLKALDHVCREMTRFMERGDAKSYIRKNFEFHFLLLHACGNPWLIRILENLHVQTNRFIVMHYTSPQDGRFLQGAQGYFEPPGAGGCTRGRAGHCQSFQGCPERPEERIRKTV